MSKAYAENYAFDSEKMGLIDSIKNIGNLISDMFFSIDKNIAYLGMQIIRFAMNLNFAELLGTQLDSIQRALKDSIFEPLYLIGFCGVAAALVTMWAIGFL